MTSTPTYHKCHVYTCNEISIAYYVKYGKNHYVCGKHKGEKDHYEYQRDIEHIIRQRELLNEYVDMHDFSCVMSEIADYIQEVLDNCNGPYEMEGKSDKKRKISK